jgi:cytochrome b6
VIVLPLVFVGILGLHLLFIQIQGMHEPEFFENQPESQKKYIKFFPNFVVKDLYVWLLAMNFLGILAALFPWDLGVEADPLKPAPAGIKPEWYFLSMFQFLKLIPGKVLFIDGEMVGIGFFTLVGLIWFAVPFIDGRSASGRRQRLVFYFGIALLAGIIIFTIWGKYSA